jgi:hypothetical protein
MVGDFILIPTEFSNCLQQLRYWIWATSMYVFVAHAIAPEAYFSSKLTVRQIDTLILFLSFHSKIKTFTSVIVLLFMVIAELKRMRKNRHRSFFFLTLKPVVEIND